MPVEELRCIAMSVTFNWERQRERQDIWQNVNHQTQVARTQYSYHLSFRFSICVNIFLMRDWRHHSSPPFPHRALYGAAESHTCALCPQCHSRDEQHGGEKRSDALEKSQVCCPPLLTVLPVQLISGSLWRAPKLVLSSQHITNTEEGTLGAQVWKETGEP